VIISHRHEYLFIEIPHTASTAISKELREHYAGESILYKHANYSEFKHQASPAEKKYFKFCAVRNPLDIVVTEYSKYRSNHREAYTRPSAWARNGGWVLDSHLDRYQYIMKHDASFEQFFAHYYTSIYHNWFLVGHAELDCIMRFERIGEDFERVLRKIGIEPVRTLPVINASQRSQELADYWTPKAYARAAHIFGPFMRQWGYRFPGDDLPPAIDWSERIRYNALEMPVNVAARIVALSPYSSMLQKISNLLRKLGLSQ